MRSFQLAVAVMASLPLAAWAETSPDGAKAPAPSAPTSRGAQDAVPPSSHARALSRVLVPRRTWDRLLDRSAQGLSEAVSRSLTTKGAKVPNGLQGDIRKQLGESMKYEAAVDAQAQALQKRFTPEELDNAARFYGSPVGKKMLERLPEAQSEVGDKLQEQLAMVVPEILHRVAPDALGPSTPDQDAGSQASPPAPRDGVGAGP